MTSGRIRRSETFYNRIVIKMYCTHHRKVGQPKAVYDKYKNKVSLSHRLFTTGIFFFFFKNKTNTR